MFFLLIIMKDPEFFNFVFFLLNEESITKKVEIG